MKKLALREARKSKNRFRHGVVIINGGRVLACHHNSKMGRHAEIRAINKGSYEKMKGATLISARLKRDGSLGCAFPCKKCQQKIIDAGISEIIYIGRNGIWKLQKIS